jgi:3-hydroxybutyrate dehydrogenase
MTPSLQGRTALVTGGAGGIGFACVTALADAGATVHLVDQDANATAEAAAATGATGHVADLLDDTVIDRLPADVDILVNNAGIQHVAPIPEFPVERFTTIQRLMVTVPFLLMRRVIPSMYRQGWGRLIHISSVHGVRASAHKAAYVAAKHGIEGLSKVAALEGAHRGVTSNCVSPGYVRTPLVEGQIAAQSEANGVPEDEVVEQVLLRRSAIKRLIEPADVAALVLWLTGEHANHLTGASLPIDGGWTAG